LISRFVRTRRKKLLINPKYVTMKQIYSLLAGVAFVSAAFGQGEAPKIKTFPGLPGERAVHVNKKPEATFGSVAPTPFNGWFDPVADPAYNRDLFSGTSPKVTYYSNTIWQDSTVVVSDAAGNYRVDLHSMGAVLDPTSSFLYTLPNGDPSGGSEGPILTSVDPYSLDSILIDVWYIKKKINVSDTLYVWTSWQKPANNDVFVKRNTGALWNTPISTWRDSILSIRLDTIKLTEQTGHVIRPAAASTNISLVKYVLTNNDTALIVNGGRNVVRIKIPVAEAGKLPLTIPAGNVVTTYVSYIPAAGSVAKGDCIYQYGSTPKKAQNANGMALRMWGQPSTDTARYDVLVDPSSKVSGAVMLPAYDRFPTNVNPPGTLYKYSIRGYLTYGPAINFHIFGNSSVGINELSAEGNFSLGQNVPNPFTNSTTISYQLKNNAKNISLAIYNVAGVKVFDQAKSNQSTGKYNVEVDATNFAPGVYFYSLVVDGSRVTKKMVITE
jgi:hypothetical protein